MQISLEEFNKEIPIGTEVLFFPQFDCLPIITTRTSSEAYEGFNNPVVDLECGHPAQDIRKIETCSQEQFNQIVKILDVRN